MIMHEKEPITGVHMPNQAIRYYLIDANKLCALYRETRPKGVTLSIQTGELIEEDFDGCYGPIRAHRGEYLVQLKRGDDHETERFETLTPLVEYLCACAPELTPAMYYHLLTAYANDSAVHQARSLMLLGVKQTVLTSFEARLHADNWFAEDELAYREAFYCVGFVHGELYDLLILPKQREIDQMILGSRDAPLSDGRGRRSLLDVGLFLRGLVSLQSPPWSRASYATLLRRWAACIDALVESPYDREVLQMFKHATLLSEDDSDRCNR